ncbi:site-specific integrase [Streptomyces sp. NBC_00691]|uniref:site-specific integrase n=1 Tax=Streptomyces sp. NBC_00691 TaxID=2903671 RepID=UPI002E35A794|nr:site-specific integrase [Streptomyces sp. NBC_00691]
MQFAPDSDQRGCCTSLLYAQETQEARTLVRASHPCALGRIRTCNLLIYVLWLLMVSTGLRRREVLALTWSDVDLGAGQLRVRRNLQRIKRELLFGTPTTARSIRTVSLPKRCVDALHAHRVTQEQERKVAGAKWKPLDHQPGGLIFTTSTGRATDPRSLNRMLTLLCAKAKVRRIRVHDLRHTCASLLLAQGVDARIIMETLGHSTITMTLDTYAHVMQTTLRAAAERMDDALGLETDQDENDHDSPSSRQPNGLQDPKAE